MGVAWWGCAIFGSRTIPLAAVAHQVENIFRFLAKMTFDFLRLLTIPKCIRLDSQTRQCQDQMDHILNVHPWEYLSCS